uniref:F-box domain-containing protein n=1 Tax=Caenorhabditis tropicalis TaxID=1561998 RepID=A0A1I7UTL6_9PELO
MNLLRLPFVVLIDIFKNMDFKDKFLISLLSKRARKTLKLTSAVVHLSFELMADFIIYTGTPGSGLEVTDEEFDYLIGGEVMRLSIGPTGVILREIWAYKRLLLANHLLDTFRKPTISVGFHFPTEPLSAWEFMKMINKRKLCVKSFTYDTFRPSSKFIPRILDECTEVTDLIYIKTIFPEDFVYTPPRLFKVREFCVSVTFNWFDIESFTSCRRIIIHETYRSPEYWNTFFRNWMDSEAPLEYMSCRLKGIFDFPLIVDGLSNEEIKQKKGDEWIEVKRKNGSEFVIGMTSNILFIETKEKHLENV